jgi:pyruvate dehydrogenase E2 component (dihydrolipoamide acetyltransferase)
MSAELTMPALSPTMEKGTLAKWLVKEGDAVRPGDLLAEIETDKATMEVEAADAGIIGKLLVAEGTEDVEVGAAIALFTADGDAPAAPSAAAPVAISAAPAQAPVAELAVVMAERESPPATAAPATAIKASPLARRIALAEGLDLTGIIGSGPRGKILKSDLGLTPPRSVAVPALAVAAGPAPQALPPPASVPFETVKLSGMRKTIARRLSEAKQSVPHFYLGLDLRLDDLLRTREELNASLATQHIKLSVNDFLIKALGIALERVPDANVQFAGDDLYRFARVDISMAVAVPGGLITPVIRDAANRRLSQIAVESRDLAERARAGKLAPEDYQGGTASISNLGMFGMKTIIPVINPPQSLILGVGAAEERAISVNRELVVATMLSVTASFDHRAIDGAIGAEFLRTFKTIVENPIVMLV